MNTEQDPISIRPALNKHQTRRKPHWTKTGQMITPNVLTLDYIVAMIWSRPRDSRNILQRTCISKFISFIFINSSSFLLDERGFLRSIPSSASSNRFAGIALADGNYKISDNKISGFGNVGIAIISDLSNTTATLVDNKIHDVTTPIGTFATGSLTSTYTVK